MPRQTEEHDSYYIPPNFIDTGTVWGGMLKLRNAIEAGIIVGVIVLPVFYTSLTLTVKIIIACVIALPLALLALIGINGESLSAFVLSFFKFLLNKRVVGGDLTVKKQKKPKKTTRTVSSYLPIEDIRSGIIITKDHRYVKIIEVTPINFLLRSAKEQRNIIYSFISYLKISPAKMQIKVLTKKADVNRHLYKIEDEISRETDEKCRALQIDYANLIRQLGSREAITRRFFIIFEYEGIGGRRGSEDEAVAELNSAAQTATVFLRQCGNEVVQYDNDDNFTADVLYNLLNRNTAVDKTIEDRIVDLMTAESYDDAKLPPLPP